MCTHHFFHRLQENLNSFLASDALKIFSTFGTRKNASSGATSRDRCFLSDRPTAPCKLPLLLPTSPVLPAERLARYKVKTLICNRRSPPPLACLSFCSRPFCVARTCREEACIVPLAELGRGFVRLHLLGALSRTRGNGHLVAAF